MPTHALRKALLAFYLLNGLASGATNYFGSNIGKFKTYYHEVVGDIFAVDEKTLYIKGFTYDGAGPDAFFWAGSTNKPDPTGTIIPDEKGQVKPLRAYRNENLVLRLPPGKSIKDFKWLSVWCRKFKANFGELFISATLTVPSPAEIGELSRLEHGVSSGPITMIDAQTFLVRDFTYDGEGPAAYWWASKGPKQHARGLRLRDENNSDQPLRRYGGETVMIEIPGDKTFLDVDWLGVWCEEFSADFGNVKIPHNLIVPPSPRMLGLKSESEPATKLNCEVLNDANGFEIRWILEADQIVLQMVAQVEDDEYMAFGLSKDDTKSEMINGDAIVAWVDKAGRGHAIDYFLGTKEQCVGDRGSCPDIRVSGAKENSVLINSAVINGFATITVKRPQAAKDERYDQNVYSDGPQAIIWAVGPLNNRNEVSYHRLRTQGNKLIDFARTPKWNCPPPDTYDKRKAPPKTPKPLTTRRKPEESTNPNAGGVQNDPWRHQNQGNANRPTKAPVTVPPPRPTPAPFRVAVSQAPRFQQPRLPSSFGPPQQARTPAAAASSPGGGWQIPPVVCPSDRTFRMQIGPAGGKKGYQGITGKVGWGIAWYVNGLLVPELTVQRGKIYTFVVEGGKDTDTSAKHHPLYLTTNPEGGYEHKNAQERSQEKVLAGVGRNRQGVLGPTAAGRLCEWKIDPRDARPPESYNSFEDFAQSLTLDCQPGQAVTLRWRPHRNTPDLVYYQCYTHRLLGWKIHVVDNCDEYQAQASFVNIQNVTYPDAQALSPNKTDKGKSFEKPYKLMPNLFARKKPTLAINPPKRPEDNVPLPPTQEKRLFGQPHPSHDVISLTNGRPSPAVLDEGVFVVPQDPSQGQSSQERPSETDNRPDGNVLFPQNPNQNFYLIPVQQQFVLGPGQSASSGPVAPPPPSLVPESSQRVPQTINLPPSFPRPEGNFGKPKVFFEGGFVPVIYRNGTFHQQSRMPDPTTPPPGYNRPLPFKGEDSVPFQGTFKPGKPDFSGFTIPKQTNDRPTDTQPQGSFAQPTDTQAVLTPSGHFGRRPPPFGPQGSVPISVTERPPVQTTESEPEPIVGSQEPSDALGEPLVKIIIPDEGVAFAEPPSEVAQGSEVVEGVQDSESESAKPDSNLSEENQASKLEKPVDVSSITDIGNHKPDFEQPPNEEAVRPVPNQEPIAPAFQFPETSTIDNETDYSILSHVLSLIQDHAQPPPAFRADRPRISRAAFPDHTEGHAHTHNPSNQDEQQPPRNSALGIFGLQYCLIFGSIILCSINTFLIRL